MSAFDGAMAALLADPHLGVDALYRAGGTGSPVALRVLRTSPDRIVSGFDTEIVGASDILSVPISLLPNLAPGDSFAIGADLLTVSHATRDGSGTAWRVYCQR
jgi:hypothetical protein